MSTINSDDLSDDATVEDLAKLATRMARRRTTFCDKGWEAPGLYSSFAHCNKRARYAITVKRGETVLRFVRCLRHHHSVIDEHLDGLHTVTIKPISHR